MLPTQFGPLLELVKPMIMKRNAVIVPILPDESLAITLRFLASGEIQTSFSNYFKIWKATVFGLAEEVCQAIWKHMLKVVLRN